MRRRSPGGIPTSAGCTRARLLRRNAASSGLRRCDALAILTPPSSRRHVFTLTLHVQSGLGYSALRAGLTFVPTAVVFGAVALTWRRWPAAWQRALTPAGFVLTALGVTGVGLAFHGGGDGGVQRYVAYAGAGAGLALAFSPTFTGALATVRPEEAADASGLLATVTQLGQLIGVAAFGTLFLNRLESLGGPRAYTSAEALSACAWALAATAAAGAVSGLVLRRR